MIVLRAEYSPASWAFVCGVRGVLPVWDQHVGDSVLVAFGDQTVHVFFSSENCQVIRIRINV